MTEYVTVWHDHEPTKLHWGVPVVRCRDCLSWFRGECRKHEYVVTDEYGDEHEEGAFPMDADGYCSLGAPRGDAE